VTSSMSARHGGSSNVDAERGGGSVDPGDVRFDLVDGAVDHATALETAGAR